VPNRYWNVQSQIADLERLDQYLESVSDQERPLRESEYFTGRLMLRSQRSPERFWVLDAWTEKIALDAGTIMLRTMATVAGLLEPPHEVPMEQIAVGSNGLGDVESPKRGSDEDPLPFFLIAENHVKPVSVDEYILTQDGFTRELESFDGFRRRLLLQDTRRRAHFMVMDEWESERKAFDAFEKRSAVVDEITMTRFHSLLQERGQQDFALSISD
jgi:quinol monooxygenase YgiN